MNRKKVNFRRIIGSMLIVIFVLLTGCTRKEKDETLLTGESKEEKPEKNTIIVSEIDKNKTEHPEEYYIKWAVPTYINVKDEWLDKFNTMLEADGFPFGLKLIRIEDDSTAEKYENFIYSCGADIVFTGMGAMKDESGNVVSIPERGLAEGKFVCLDEYLKDSPLYKTKSEYFWNRAAYNGSIYFFPSEILQIDAEVTLYCKDLPFDGNILSLSDYVTDNTKVFYGLSGFDFMHCFGFFYDELKGVVISKDGEIVNPFELEKCIDWLRKLNEWYKKGILVTNDSGSSDREKCDIRLGGKLHNRKINYSWKKGLCRNCNCVTAILSSSERKEQAFKLLELLRTNHDYGNLLIYGIDPSENNEPSDSAYLNKLVFGIDDGLKQVDDGLLHFEKDEDRKRYYTEEIEISPSFNIDFSSEYQNLYKLVKEYLGTNNGIFTRSNFDIELEEFRTKYTEALKKVSIN